MEDGRTIVPSQIAALRTVDAEEVETTSEAVLEATYNLNKTCEALEDLSISLADLIKKKNVYDDMVPHIKKQMRELSTRL